MFSGNNNNCTDNIIYKEEELLEEKKFVLKYSERNYEIKIQLVKINDVHYIRITAQEEKVIINYIYLTEMNEDDFIKQNNKILKLYDNIQEIFVNKLETENKNLNFKVNKLETENKNLNSEVNNLKPQSPFMNIHYTLK